MAERNPVLGVDVGGVILDFIAYGRTHPDVAKGSLEIPSVENSIESVKTLNASEKFGGKVFLVSRYSGPGPEYVLAWLAKQDFFSKTGIPQDHFYPCAKREEKLPIVKKLGITHFVDDRAEVLGYMRGIVEHRYLFQALDEDEKAFADVRKELLYFETWKELLPVLLK